jgi:ribosomal protein S18 acetylase RimI-like enzyme
LPGHVHDTEYEADLYDVRTRAESPGCTVLVAVDADGTITGGVTFVADALSPMAEHAEPGAASIRMLAVDDVARRRGIGDALVQECIARARAAGATQVVLHSTPWMHAAHRLYGRHGFSRDESLDWRVDGIDLLGFRLALDGA